MMKKYKLNFGLTAIDYGFSLTHQYIGDSDNIGLNGENLTIVVLSCNRSDLTIRLIDSLIEHVPNFEGEILIYDNASDSDDLKRLEKHLMTVPVKSKLIKSSVNYGVAGGRNRAVSKVQAGWMMLLDNDIYFKGNPFEICRKTIASLGCYFLNIPLMNADATTVYCNGGSLYVYTDDTDKRVGLFSMYEPTTGEKSGIESVEMNVEFMPSLSSFLYGGSAIMNRDRFLQNGGFDEGFFIGFEDLDFSITLFKNGYKIGSAGIFALVHDHKRLDDDSSFAYEKVRFSNEKLYESALYFEKKNGLKVWSHSTESWIKQRRKELGIKNDVCIKSADVNKRSILFCIHSLTGGGAEKLLVDILNRIDATLFDIDVCVLSRGGVYDKDLPGYVDYYVYSDDDAFPDKQYDVEIAFLQGAPVKLVALHPSNAVKIAWVHTDMYAHRLSAGDFNNQAEEALCYNRMDHIIFVSQNSMKQFERLFPGVHANKTVIYNMINREEVISKSLQAPCPIEKTKMTMCTLARLVPVKGIERLIPILSRLKKEGLDFHYWIIGDGYQKKTILQLIEQFDLQNTVFLLGFQKNPFPYLKASDIFVSVSFVEGLPLVVCEALCLSKPIFATNNPGTVELLDHGKYGFLVEPDDESVYKGLKLFLTCESIRNEYALKAQAGSGIDRFDLQKNIHRVNDLLHHASSTKSELERIVQRIYSDCMMNDNIGLRNGKMGKAIFFFHYARTSKNKLHEDYAFALIDEITVLLNKETPVDYETGLAGIGAGIEYLVQNGFIDADTDDILEEIEQKIHLSIPYETNSMVLVGIGLYLLSRIRNPASGDHKLTTLENKIFLIHVIDLIERFYPQQSEEGIACVYHFLTEVDNINLFPAKVKRLIKEIKSGKTINSLSARMTQIERIYTDFFNYNGRPQGYVPTSKIGRPQGYVPTSKIRRPQGYAPTNPDS